LPTLFGISLLSFGLLHAANADPSSSVLPGGVQSSEVSSAAVLQLRRLYGLDEPWYVQYGQLLRRFAALDLGTRWQDGRSIRDVLGEALPVSMSLMAAALTLAYALAVPLGAYAAARRGSRVDHGISMSLSVLYSVPAFWVGTLLLSLLASGRFLTCSWLPHGACFPLQGWHSFAGFERMTPSERLLDVLWHGVLPVVTLGYPVLAVVARHLRAGMLDTLQLDYIRTARAKGLPEHAVVYGHALRNSFLPVITLLGLELPRLISGAVIVEWIFGIRGMGLVAFEALRMPDYPMVVAIVTLTALFTLAGSIVADVGYAWLDPRLRQRR
jgi:peptide/nickel transport system permease protein